MDLVYKIDHYYNRNHDQQCLLIKSNIECRKLIKILAAIQFKFEELIDDSVVVDEMYILELLIKFYGVKDVKEQYKKYLKYMHIEACEWDVTNTFYVDNDKLKITQIDLYRARELNCGPSYKKLIDEFLPSSKEFEALIYSFKSFVLKDSRL